MCLVRRYQLEIRMPNEIETMIRTSAPRVTLDPDAFLAALDVSDEAAATLRTVAKRRRFAWVIGGATVVAIAVGTNAAAAATQTLWWSAPHAVTEQMAPVTNSATPVKSVRYVLSAGFASGVDSGSAKAKVAFQLAQDWLVAHPVVVTVPKAAQTLTAGEKSRSAAQGEPAQLTLEDFAPAGS
jgi:hypothetical protein